MISFSRCTDQLNFQLNTSPTYDVTVCIIPGSQYNTRKHGVMVKTAGHYLRHKHDTVWLAESSLLMLAEAQFLHHITTDIMLPLYFWVVYSASIIIPSLVPGIQVRG